MTSIIPMNTTQIYDWSIDICNGSITAMDRQTDNFLVRFRKGNLFFEAKKIGFIHFCLRLIEL